MKLAIAGKGAADLGIGRTALLATKVRDGEIDVVPRFADRPRAHADAIVELARTLLRA